MTGPNVLWVFPPTLEPNLPSTIQSIFHTDFHFWDQRGFSVPRLPSSQDHWSLTTGVKHISDTQQALYERSVTQCTNANAPSPCWTDLHTRGDKPPTPCGPSPP